MEEVVYIYHGQYFSISLRLPHFPSFEQVGLERQKLAREDMWSANNEIKNVLLRNRQPLRKRDTDLSFL